MTVDNSTSTFQKAKTQALSYLRLSRAGNSLEQRIIDYDLHGIVGIRVIGHTPSDTAAVAYQLGLPPTSLNREPDITIRFKEALPTPGIKYLGLNRTSFTEEGFYVLISSKAKAKVRIPFECIGGRCEILCESGLRAVPLLSHIINLTFIKKNYIPLHASAFVYNDVGILVVGWATGGKTEALLSFANHGAQYIGDEWVILSGDGREMFGIPTPTSIKEWQFEYLPNLLPKISIQKQMLFKSIHFLDGFHRTFGKGKLKGYFPFTALSDALPYFKKQLKIWVSPRKFFANQFHGGKAKLDKLFLIMLHGAPDVTVNPGNPEDIAERMIGTCEYEQLHFWEYFKAFKFAFPHLENEFLENLNELQKSLIYGALEGKEAYKVAHPYPVSLEKLFQKMRPFCEKRINHSVAANLRGVYF